MVRAGLLITMYARCVRLPCSRVSRVNGRRVRLRQAGRRIGSSYRRSDVASVSVASSTSSIVTFMYPLAFRDSGLDRAPPGRCGRCRELILFGHVLAVSVPQQSPTPHGCSAVRAAPRAKTTISAYGCDSRLESAFGCNLGSFTSIGGNSVPICTGMLATRPVAPSRVCRGESQA